MKPFLSEPMSTMVPAVAAIEINTAVDTELDDPCRALWVGTAGNLDVVMMNGEEVTFANVEGLLPIRVKEIKGTSTAEDVVAAY